MSKQTVKDIFEVSLKTDSSNNGNGEILKELLANIGKSELSNRHWKRKNGSGACL